MSGERRNRIERFRSMSVSFFDVWAIRKLRLIALLLVPFAVAGCAGIPEPLTQGSAPSTHHVAFDFSELNWSGVDVSPDGQTILFDALGDLYAVPITGGNARVVRSGASWDMMPRFSPDGNKIAFSSDTGMGTFDIWMMPVAGGQASLLAAEPTYMLHPEWAPDGQSVIALRQLASSAGTSPFYDLFNGWAEYKVIPGLDTSSSRTKLIEDGLRALYPSFDRSGRYLYFAALGEGPDASNLRAMNLDNAQITDVAVPLREGERPFAPRISPDGRTAAYLVAKDDVVVLRATDLDTQSTRDLLTSTANHAIFAGGGPKFATASYLSMVPGYAFTPDSREIVIAIGGSIQRVEVETGKQTPVNFQATFKQDMPIAPRTEVPFDDGPVEVKQMRWPSLSPDRQTLAFSALGKVWTHDIKTGSTDRVNRDGGREYAPAFSPDGSEIAYVAWADDGSGHIMRVDAGEGKTPTPVTRASGYYLNPTWSPDGSKIAFLQPRQRSHAVGETFSGIDLKWIDLSTGSVQTMVSDINNIGGWRDRKHTPLTFSQDGRRVFYTSLFEIKPGSHRVGLFSVDMNGENIKQHLSTSSIDLSFEQFVVSPDGMHVAISQGGQLWVASLADIEAAMKDGSVLNGESLAAMPDALVSNRQASYIWWTNPQTIVWSLANTVYETQVDVKTTKVLATVGLTVPQAIPEGRVAYTNARVVTMAKVGTIERATILVEGNRIVDIRPAGTIAIPEQAQTIDLAGKTVIPGLIDTHAHAHWTGSEYFWEQRPEYLSNLAYGVTTLFDVASDLPGSLTQAEMVASGDLIGPRLFTVGRSILGDRYKIENLQDAQRITHDLREHGAWGVKSYLIPRRNQRQWLIEAARGDGLGVVTHYDLKLWMPLVAAAEGHIGVEHMMPVPPIREDWVKYLAATETHITPTLFSSRRDGKLLFVKEQLDNDPKIRRFILEKDRRSAVRSGTEALKGGVKAESSRFKAEIAGMANVLRAGGHVSMGAHGELNGPDAHVELRLLVMGGFTPLEALSTYTSEAAHKVGLESQIGSLQKGYLADFVVLNSNPLEDIRNTDDIKYVVKDGFLYDAESMTQLYPDYKPLPKPSWQSDADWEAIKAPVPAPLSKTSRSPTVQ